MTYKESLTPTKVIDTCLRAVDVSDYELVFDHPIMLQLMEKSQLSFGDRVFPGGRHSRYEHSVFIYHFTDELTKYLLKKGCLTKQQAIDVRIASILHDIGHSPFSHSIGNLLGYIINPEIPKTHNNRSVELLNSEERDSSGRTIKDLISMYGGNFQKVVGIVAKNAPEAPIISHHTLGTDKMGYTLVDCHHTGYLIDKPFFLDMFPFIFYNNGKIGISEEKTPQVVRLQNLIQEMYINVYFNEKIKQFSRFVEKAVELEIGSGKLTPEQVWDMSEDALTYLLKNSGNENVRQLLKRYSRNELYETVTEFNIENRTAENASRKGGTIIKPIKKEFSDDLIKRYLNPRSLTKLERKICDTLKLPFTDLMVTLSADPKRIMPEDTLIYTKDGKRIDTLFSLYPAHHASLLEKAENFFALRVHTTRDLKDYVMSFHDAVIEMINDDLKQT